MYNQLKWCVSLVEYLRLAMFMFCIQQIGNKGNSGGTGMCNIVEPEEVYVLNANVPGNLPANVWDSTNKHEDV